jgi:hypothetical protein
LAEQDHNKHVLVNMRPDGSYWILDRQHHVEAALRCGHHGVTCWVIYGLARWEECHLFVQFQELQQSLYPAELV